MPLQLSRIGKHIFFFVLLVLSGKVVNANEIAIRDSLAINFTYYGDLSKPDPFFLSSYVFRKDPDNRSNFGFTGSEFHFVLLKISTDTSTNSRSLLIDNTSLDTISVYKVMAGKVPELIYQAGNLIPFDRNRYSEWHILPMELDKGDSYFLLAVKASQKNINFTYEIIEHDQVFKNYQSYQRFVFFYVGIAFILSLIIFSAFVLFKRKVFGAYLGYIICISGWILAHYGVLFPVLYPGIPRNNEIIKPISSLGAAFFMLQVIRFVFTDFISGDRFLSVLFRFIINWILFEMILALVLLLPGLNPLFISLFVTSWHISIIISLLLIICIPLYLCRTSTVAKIFSAAMVIICLLAVVQFFGNTGYIKNYFLNEHGAAFGTLLENSIIAAGLIYGLFQEQVRQRAQVRLLEEEQLTILKKLITVQDNERKRIAGDLHDTIGPLLAAIKINFRRLLSTTQNPLQPELVHSTEMIIDDSINEIRAISHNLMPKGLSSKGLINTLSDYFGDLQSVYNCPVEFIHSIDSIIDPELQINLYRIICEITHNAAKHSNASCIEVSIHSDNRQIELFVSDNGCGFDFSDMEKNVSVGLQNAESRVQYLKGEFELWSKAGEGTKVGIRVPL